MESNPLMSFHFRRLYFSLLIIVPDNHDIDSQDDSDANELQGTER